MFNRLSVRKLFVALSLMAVAGTAPAEQTMPDASCTTSANLAGNRSYQVKLPTYDGHVVSFQVMEPKTFNCAGVATGAHPLMLHGPGYGSSRSTSGFTNYRDAGYTVISWDPRGFGDTSGTVRVMDPEFEGQYYVQILDWAEQNLDYLAWRNEATDQFVARPASKSSVAGGVNLVVGAQGGSYGGGYQLMLLTVDGKKRLDAIAPDITWHDLRNSLNPGDAVKSLWGSALVALGEAQGHASGGVPNDDGQDPYIKETTARGQVFNEWPRQSLDWFRYRGLGYWCAASGLPSMPYLNYGTDTVPMVDVNSSYNVPALQGNGRPGYGTYLQQPSDPASYFRGLDVLLTQGMIDTLFNFNEAWWNYQCLTAAGADVSLYTHNSGHALPGAQSPDKLPANTGSCSPDTKAWFDARLAGGAPKTLAQTCFALGAAGDAVTLAGKDVLAPRASNRFTTRTVTPIAPVPNGIVGLAQTSGNAPVHASLGTISAEAILAGMPRVNITVASVDGFHEMAQDCAAPELPTRTGCDSTIFVGIGKKSGPSPTFGLIDDQVQPIRGLGQHQVSLVGIAERLQAGDELAVLFYAAHPQFYGSESRDTTIPAVKVSGTASLPLFAANADHKPVPGVATPLSGTDPTPPSDSDGDGVVDSNDTCPDTAAGASVDANGCSAAQKDSDGDGVSDAADTCPDTAAGASVDANGCTATQRDSDGDGVNDAVDQCPATTAGSTVDANGCPVTVNHTLIVNLSADRTSGDVSSQALTVNFSAAIEDQYPQGGSLSYVFYYGDGTNSGLSSSATASHVYSKAGRYEPRVVVIDESNHSDEDSLTITTTTQVTIDPDPIVVTANLTLQVSGTAAPVTAMFDASGSTAPEGSIFRFEFGDGSSQQGTSKQATKTYALAGSYTITLTVTDAADATNTDTATATLNVGSGQQTTAQLVVSPSTARIGETVTFDARASVPAEGRSISSFEFAFGDSTTLVRTVAEFGVAAGLATHAYSVSGTFTPTVTVTDSAQAKNAVSAQMHVLPAAPAPAPVNSTGGGGALGALTLLPLALFGLRRRRPKA